MKYFGAQNDPENGPMKPIFNTTLKVDQIYMYNKADAKAMEWPKNGIFYFGGHQSEPKKRPYSSHI